MKAYKIDLSGFTGKVREVVSEAVQKKAFELGYKWPSGGKVVQNTWSPLVFTNSDGTVKKSDDEEYFAEDKNTAIDPADFLALALALETTKEPEFKPFNKVLARDTDEDEWFAGHFSHMTENHAYRRLDYVVDGEQVGYCIPYEGNEHLIGTTDSPK